MKIQLICKLFELSIIIIFSIPYVMADSMKRKFGKKKDPRGGQSKKEDKDDEDHHLLEKD